MKATDEDILDAIGAMTRRHGYPPTVRELARHLGMASQGSLNTRIDRLVAKGVLTREDRKARTLKIL